MLRTHLSLFGEFPVGEFQPFYSNSIVEERTGSGIVERDSGEFMK